MDKKMVAAELVKIAKSLVCTDLRPMEDIEYYYNQMLLEYGKEIKRGRIHENMGDKYIRKFDDFVGDMWSYSYSDRLNIQKMMRELSLRTSIV